MNWLSAETLQRLTLPPEKRQRKRRHYGFFHYDNVLFSRKFVEKGRDLLIIGRQAVDLAEQLQTENVYALELGSVDPSYQPSPNVHPVAALQEAFKQGHIGCVILPYTLQMIDDIQAFLDELHSYLQPDTRVVILQYNFFWAPLLRIAQVCLGWSDRMNLNWLNLPDLRNLLLLTKYQEVTSGSRCLIPFKIPLLTAIVNRYIASLPFFSGLCLKQVMIARPLKGARGAAEPAVSIVVPARNEQGNMAGIFDRLPVLGSSCELIFVEGHSKDDTWGEIQRQMASHPRRSQFLIKAFQQEGKGKADAVRLGFSRASGDLFMILDADLSVQPEDLNHFYSGLREGTAEFLNGSRLVYKMESEAMQVLNLFFNKLFALWVSWLIGQPIKDTLCGTKVLYRKDYERIRNSPAGFGNFDPFGDFELLFGASYLHLKICDVPVRYKQRTYGTTNISRFRNGWELLKVCLASWPRMKG